MSNGASPRFELQHDPTGQLVLVDANGVRHTGVGPVRSFPISEPDHWISICDSNGRELAVVQDLNTLSPAVRTILEQDLAKREFVPLIRRIVSVPADSEPTEWAVETDRGQTRFELASADDVRQLGADRALVIDARGIRYLIEDIRSLDALSRRVLERYL